MKKTENLFLVDSHCHLNYDGLYENIDDIMLRANEANIGIMQTICTRMSEVEHIRNIAYRYKNVFYSIGIHPLHVHEDAFVDAEQLILISQQDCKIIGFGETGLDYYRTSDPQIIEQQKDSFIQHIIASQQTGIPVIIHTRDAETDTLRIVTEHMAKKTFSGVLHCFTGSYELAQTCVEMGILVSASGIITFKNADAIRDVFRKLPLESILIETDSPFLAPVPYRGKTNEPSYVVEVAKMLAKIKGISYEEVVNVTTKNFIKLIC